MSDRKIRLLLAKFMDQRRLWSTEGARGVNNLTTITQTLGYRDLNGFLEDNPGAVQAVIHWISTQNSPEFAESLAQATES